MEAGVELISKREERDRWREGNYIKESEGPRFARHAPELQKRNAPAHEAQVGRTNRPEQNLGRMLAGDKGADAAQEKEESEGSGPMSDLQSDPCCAIEWRIRIGKRVFVRQWHNRMGV